MKDVAILILAGSLLLIGCKETKKEASIEQETSKITVEHDNRTGATQGLDNSWISDMVLNDGNKWQANEETTEGVLMMQALIDDSKLSSQADYQKLGEKLNEVKNMVVKECTMQGASHDNLHIWLYPLIEKIELLQNSESVEEGIIVTSKIKIHLKDYYKFFN